jgi:four helix bundle protein
MAARHFEELIAWQLAEAFKEEVFRITQVHRGANWDLRLKSQLLDAASAVPSDIAEGFVRRSPLVFANFLDYAIGSLVEAERRLVDGSRLGLYAASTCDTARRLARRCLTATVRLKQSQIRYAEDLRASRRNRSNKRPPGRRDKPSTSSR